MLGWLFGLETTFGQTLGVVEPPHLFVIGVWNYWFWPRQPPHMDARISQMEFANPDEMYEEFDSFPSSKPLDLVSMRYDRLQIVAVKV